MGVGARATIPGDLGFCHHCVGLGSWLGADHTCTWGLAGCQDGERLHPRSCQPLLTPLLLRDASLCPLAASKCAALISQPSLMPTCVCWGSLCIIVGDLLSVVRCESGG